MSAPDLSKIRRIPGRLVLGPTNLAIPYPFGGTPLGFSRDNRFTWGVMTEDRVAEELGCVNEIAEVAYRPVFGFAAEQTNDVDMLSLVFQSTTATSQTLRIDGVMGPRVIPAMPQLLLAPFDPRNKALLIRRPVSMLPPEAYTAFSRIEEAVFPLIVKPTPDSTGRPPFAFGELWTLSL